MPRYIVKETVVFDVIDTENLHDNEGFMARQATRELAEESAANYERAQASAEEAA